MKKLRRKNEEALKVPLVTKQESKPAAEKEKKNPTVIRRIIEPAKQRSQSYGCDSVLEGLGKFRYAQTFDKVWESHSRHSLTGTIKSHERKSSEKPKQKRIMQLIQSLKSHSAMKVYQSSERPTVSGQQQVQSTERPTTAVRRFGQNRVNSANPSARVTKRDDVQ